MWHRRSTPAVWKGSEDSSATETDIYYCFRLLLGRRPSQTEWLSHLQEVGQDLTTVVGFYLNSPEFANRTPAKSLRSPWERAHRPVADDNDIFYCFRLLLGRSPSREEWPGHTLAVGQDLATVVKRYVTSLEFANRHFLDHSTSDYEICELADFSMYLSRSDLAVGAHIAKTRVYEPHVTRVLKERLSPGMTFFDVGANIGFFSLLGASLVGPSGAVFSIEPNPRNVKALRASKDLNHFEHMHILQAAAGASWDVLFLNTDHSNGVVSETAGDIGELLSRETVLSCPIDSILGTAKVDLIKIDVEGFEFKALSGASRCLELHKPAIVSEFTPGALPGISKISSREYLNFFTKRGYKIYVLGANEPVPCGTDAELVMKHFVASSVDHIDILCVND
jgi:FkbM family methyltransferase